MKRAGMLGALAVMAGLAGCQSWWPDRADVRPSRDASFFDWLEYRGVCGGVGPSYHCGSLDGWKDRRAVRRAAIRNANQSLAETYSGGVTGDFRSGYQQAFLDIANGGQGNLPAVPPPRYWSAPYRTCWGHGKARDWFAGYEAGAGVAKCGSLCSTGSIPTSAQRSADGQVSIGLQGPMTATAIPATSQFIPWTPHGGFPPYSAGPGVSAPMFPASGYGPAAPSGSMSWPQPSGTVPMGQVIPGAPSSPQSFPSPAPSSRSGGHSVAPLPAVTPSSWGVSQRSDDRGRFGFRGVGSEGVSR